MTTNQIKTEIHVITVFEGEADATDVFMELIAQRHSQHHSHHFFAKQPHSMYNKDVVQENRALSGLCW